MILCFSIIRKDETELYVCYILIDINIPIFLFSPSKKKRHTMKRGMALKTKK